MTYKHTDTRRPTKLNCCCHLNNSYVITHMEIVLRKMEKKKATWIWFYKMFFCMAHSLIFVVHKTRIPCHHLSLYHCSDSGVIRANSVLTFCSRCELRAWMNAVMSVVDLFLLMNLSEMIYWRVVSGTRLSLGENCDPKKIICEKKSYEII